MVRETFGQAVDDALAQLEYAGVPRDAVAVLRARLRRDKRVVAAAIRVCEVNDWGLGAEVSQVAMDGRIAELREAVEAMRKRERVGV